MLPWGAVKHDEDTGPEHDQAGAEAAHMPQQGQVDHFLEYKHK